MAFPKQAGQHAQVRCHCFELAPGIFPAGLCGTRQAG
jgi:hypothetical protein